MKGKAGGRRALDALALLLLAGCAAAFLLARPRSFPPSSPSPGKDPVGDIVLITIDTLRADALGCYGNREAATGQLDRLAREGLVFDRAHASNVVTLPSHVNIFTGLYPYRHGVRDNTGFRLDPRFPTLATLLLKRGWATGAFVGAFPLDSRYGLDQGFEVYDDRYPPGSSPDDFEMRERPGSEVVSAALVWWEREQGRKRFLWVHLYDPHAPYRPPSPFSERFAGNPYQGEVAATDTALAPLLSLARREEDILVAVTADHGEALGDHGELTHGLFAYEATLRVPLLLWSPGKIRPGRAERAARHVDILPTILELAGVPTPPGLSGRSLFSESSAHLTYFEALSASLNRGWAPLTGILSGTYKFINLPIPELYELREDPAEKRNLFSQRPQVARRLKSFLPAGAARAEAAPARSEEAWRLLALGYLSGGSPRPKSYAASDDPKRLISLDNKIQRTIDLYQRGDAAAATRLAREMVRERPMMAVGYEFSAFLLQSAGRSLEAAEVLRAAADRGLASEGMRVRLGLIYSEAGRTEKALEALRPLSESSDPDTQNAIGIALADAGRVQDALRTFEGVLERDRENAIALQNIGIALLKADSPREALEYFDRALSISQHLPRAFNARGVAQARLGDAGGAMESWRRAAQLDSRQYDALFNMGVVAAQRGDRETARQALNRFIATAPQAQYGRDRIEARRILKGLGGA